MEQQSSAPETIHSSQIEDGCRLRPWRGDRVYSAVKTCPVCGKEYHPRIWINVHGQTCYFPESRWEKQKYCSQKCQHQSMVVPIRKRTPPKPRIPIARPIRRTWKIEALTATKNCLCCGKEIHPLFFHGIPQSRKIWNAKKYCSKSCAKKVENPMFREDVAKKVSSTLRQIGHKPKIHGGNGRPLTIPQEEIAKILGKIAETEYPIITTEKQRANGASHCYKMDVAIPYLRLAIQLDGAGHSTKKVREADKRIRVWMAELGWSVLHISNSKALELCSICKSPDTLLTMLTESWFITAI